jgi:hypothetical protein
MTPMGVDYERGWSKGIEMIDAGFNSTECIGYARWLMVERGDDLARGFFDAIVAGIGG